MFEKTILIKKKNDEKKTANKKPKLTINVTKKPERSQCMKYKECL